MTPTTYRQWLGIRASINDKLRKCESAMVQKVGGWPDDSDFIPQDIADAMAACEAALGSVDYSAIAAGSSPAIPPGSAPPPSQPPALVATVDGPGAVTVTFDSTAYQDGHALVQVDGVGSGYIVQSPWHITGMAGGTHTFAIRATDLSQPWSAAVPVSVP